MAKHNIKIRHVGELNPGLPRDRRVYLTTILTRQKVLGGIWTHNPQSRSLMHYPLCYEDKYFNVWNAIPVSFTGITFLRQLLSTGHINIYSSLYIVFIVTTQISTINIEKGNWLQFVPNSSTTAAGFEPARAKPNRFQVCLLNRSDMLSLYL